MSLRIMRICARFQNRKGYSELVGFMFEDGYGAHWRPRASLPFMTINCRRYAKQEGVQ